jgi:hypothetical protein
MCDTLKTARAAAAVVLVNEIALEHTETSELAELNGFRRKY